MKTQKYFLPRNQIFLLVFFGFSSLFSTLLLAENSVTQEPGKAVIIPIREQIGKSLLYFLRRSFQSLEKDRYVKCIVIDMDTPGGGLRETEEIISWMRNLKSKGIKIYTYVNTHAQSAGAIIGIGTDEIFMAPGSRIGSATPILMDLGGGIQEMTDDVKEKILSDTRALVRGLAQENDYNPELAMAFVDKDIEFKLGDRVICAEGKVLNLTAKEAVEIIPPLEKPILATKIVKNISDLLESKKLSHLEVVRLEPHGAENLAGWITRLAPFLMAAAFIGIYLEIKTPGFGIPGIVGIVCLILFLFGHYIAGLAGKEDIFLVLLGLCLLIVEVFILPGFGIAGILGIAALLGGMMLGMIPHLPSTPELPGDVFKSISLAPFLNQAILKFFQTILISGLGVYLLLKILPRTSVYNKIVLHREASIGDGYVGTDLAGNTKLIGSKGITITPLRPSGIAMINGQRVDVVSSGDYVDQDENIQVTEVNGPRIVVNKIEDRESEEKV